MSKVFRHSPRGECGLKFGNAKIFGGVTMSLPSRGVWVEIVLFVDEVGMIWSLPSRGVWVEIRSP